FLSLFILISLPLRSSLFPYTTLFSNLLLLSFPLLEIDRLYIYLFHSLQSLNPSYPLLNHPFLSQLIQAPLLLALLAIVLFSLNLFFVLERPSPVNYLQLSCQQLT